MNRTTSLPMGALVLTGLLSGAPVWAQTFDIINQDVHLTLIGTDTDIDLLYVIEATAPLDQIDFLMPALPVDVIELNGTPVDWLPDELYPTELGVISLSETMTTGSRAEVRLVSSGQLDCADPYYTGFSWCERSLHQTLLTPAYVGTAWYQLNPWQDDDLFVGSVSATVPSAQTVVAGQGAAREIVDNGDGTKTWTFDISHPDSALAFYSGIKAAVSSSHGFSVTGYYPVSGDNAANMSRAVEVASEVIDFYSQLYAPIPLDAASVVTVSPVFPFGGMGLLGTVLLAEPILGPYDFMLEQGMAHEFGHSWWGGLACAADMYQEGMFLNEAFAEYSAWRALGHLYDDAMRVSGVRMNSVWYMYARPSSQDVAPLDPEVYRSPMSVYAVYHKGSSVLRTLEAAAGSEQFSAALRAFVARGKYGLSVDALLEDLQNVADYDATADVEQWLRQTGFPRMKAWVEIDGGAPAEVVLHVDTEDPFSFRLPVTFVWADGTVQAQTARVSTGSTTHRWTVDQRPVAVRLDPEWTLVREIKSAVGADLDFNGQVDAADLIEVALRRGTSVPEERRRDGGYDPLYDLNDDRVVDQEDLMAVWAAAMGSE